MRKRGEGPISRWPAGASRAPGVLFPQAVRFPAGLGGTSPPLGTGGVHPGGSKQPQIISWPLCPAHCLFALGTTQGRSIEMGKWKTSTNKKPLEECTHPSPRGMRGCGKTKAAGPSSSAPYGQGARSLPDSVSLLGIAQGDQACGWGPLFP